MSALREVFAKFTTEFDGGPLEKGAESTSMLTGKMKALGAAIVGALGVNALRSFVAESAAIGDELDKTSKVIGISVEALQGWRHAANLSGVGAESFNSGVTRLQRNMFDAARGVETAALGFRELGVDVNDANGQLRPVEDVLRDMADPLKNMESGSERVAILMTLMGRSGARMGPLFAEGAEGVDRMRAELEELGGGASQEFIAQAAELTDANARLDVAFLSLRSKLATVLLPVVQRGVEIFTRLLTNTRSVKAAIATALIPTIALLSTKLYAMGIAGAVATAKAFAGFIVAGLAAFGLYLVVEDLFTAMEGGDSVTGRMIDSMEMWTEKTRDQTTALGFLARVLDKIFLLMESIGIISTDAITGEAASALAAQGVDINSASGRRFARRIGREGSVTPEAVQAYERDRVFDVGERGTAFETESTNRLRSSASAAGLGKAMGAFTPRDVQQFAPIAPGTPSNVAITQTFNVSADGLSATQAGAVFRQQLDRANREALDSLTSGDGA